MPSSRQARMMRTAISPRLAIRILRNILVRAAHLCDGQQEESLARAGNEPSGAIGDRVQLFARAPTNGPHRASSQLRQAERFQAAVQKATINVDVVRQQLLEDATQVGQISPTIEGFQ